MLFWGFLKENSEANWNDQEFAFKLKLTITFKVRTRKRF